MPERVAIRLVEQAGTSVGTLRARRPNSRHFTVA